MSAKRTMTAKLLSICSVMFILINFTSAQNPCKTPDNWDGKCIVLQQCRSLFAILQKPADRITPQQRTYLSKSQCGRDGNKVLVCCPNTFAIDDLPTCGVQVTDKIFGGERAGISEFPWLSLLHYRKAGTKGGFYCGGSLIHENYVLTAAHCIKGRDIVRMRYVLDSVRLGENDLRSAIDCQEGVCADAIQDIQIAETIVHENYDPSSKKQENDIALIRLKQPASFTNYTKPVCLPILELQNKNHDGSPLTVAGFGRIESGKLSDVKMKLEVDGINWNQCLNSYQTIAHSSISENVLCAGGEEGKDSCNGDSGGPLVASESKGSDSFSYLVGVVSLGAARCGTPGIPGVYTRVDKYIDWILDHMRKP